MSDESLSEDLVNKALCANVARAEMAVEALISDSMHQIADEFRIEEIVADVERNHPMSWTPYVPTSSMLSDSSRPPLSHIERRASLRACMLTAS